MCYSIPFPFFDRCLKRHFALSLLSLSHLAAAWASATRFGACRWTCPLCHYVHSKRFAPQFRHWMSVPCRRTAGTPLTWGHWCAVRQESWLKPTLTVDSTPSVAHPSPGPPYSNTLFDWIFRCSSAVYDWWWQPALVRLNNSLDPTAVFVWFMRCSICFLLFVLNSPNTLNQHTHTHAHTHTNSLHKEPCLALR